MENMNNAAAIINERRAAQGKTPTTLVGIVYNAARTSIAAISYREKKHAAASVRTVKNQNWEEADYIGTIAASGADTEAAAILNVNLQRFITNRDSTDRQIISGLMERKTERELAAVVGISVPTVHKRIVKIRAALAEII